MPGGKSVGALVIRRRREPKIRKIRKIKRGKKRNAKKKKI